MLDTKKIISHKQKVICILGMHRSGTSMITRIINFMGVSLGKLENMMVADENINAEGFWEHIEIVKIHEEILKELNSSWKSTKTLPDNWWNLPNIKPYKIKLLQLIKSEFGNLQIWAFKDPRTCIMLPMWKEVFEILDIEPIFVIPVRNPLDIANSLIKRDGVSLNHSIRLWYYYMINILEGTKNYSRIFIPYDDMIENPDLNLLKLTDFLGNDISEENRNCIKETLNPNLRHSKTTERELQLVASKQAYELYKSCLKFIENPYDEIELKPYSYEVYKLYSNLMEVEYADIERKIYTTSLFIDYGTGYSEKTSIKKKIIINDNSGKFSIDFKLGEKGENIKNFRWDPLEGIFCKCIIENILVNDKEIMIEKSNAHYSNEKQFDFLTTDPMCFWKNDYELVESVSVYGTLSFYDFSEIRLFFQKERENEIKIKNENTRLIEGMNRENSRNNELTKECSRLIEDMNRESSRNNELTKECSRINNENTRLIEDINRQSSKNNELTEECSRINNENTNLINDIDMVKNENNKLIREKEKIIIENEKNRLIKEKELMNSIQKFENEYKDLLDNKRKSDEKFESIINSSSWKITEPLRQLKRLFAKKKV